MQDVKSLRQLRVDCGLSQKELAQRAGCWQGDVAMWENGKKFPSPESIIKLAKALGLKPGQIFEAALISKPRKEEQAKLLQAALAARAS